MKKMNGKTDFIYSNTTVLHSLLLKAVEWERISTSI